MKSFLTKPVPMWRALLALTVGVSVSTLGMLSAAKQALEIQRINLR